MPPRIVGLVGTKGSGKTTAAKYLVSAHGYERVPFAAPLKRMLRAIGLGDAELDGDRKEEPCDLLMGVTPRHAMQMLGTEFGRNAIHPEIWLHLWKAAAARHSLVVVDDVRFANEAAVIREMGGRLIRIERGPAADLLMRGGLARSVGMDTHSSETELASIDCDTTVYNAGTVMDLHAALNAALLRR
jgi:hypothetical protein